MRTRKSIIMVGLAALSAMLLFCRRCFSEQRYKINTTRIQSDSRVPDV